MDVDKYMIKRKDITIPIYSRKTLGFESKLPGKFFMKENMNPVAKRCLTRCSHKEKNLSYILKSLELFEFF